MKLPDIYTDWRIMVGLALIILGGANWFVGRMRTRQYSELIASAGASPDKSYRAFHELDDSSDGAVLTPFTSEQQRVSYATARMDFYHATYLTGEVLVLVGLLLTFAGFITVIQRDTRRTLRRMNIKINGPSAG